MVAQALANLTPNGDVVAQVYHFKSFGQQHEHDAREIPKKLNKQLKISVKQRVSNRSWV